MADRLRIVLEDDSRRAARQQARHHRGFLPMFVGKFCMVLPLVVLVVAVYFAPRRGGWVVDAASNIIWNTNSTLLIRGNNSSWLDSLLLWNSDEYPLLPLVGCVVPMVAVLFLVTTMYYALTRMVSRQRREEIQSNLDEFVVTVYPLGVQLSSSGRKKNKAGLFIARDCILDCQIHEVIQAYRVYSSPRLMVCKNQAGGGVETIELFPQLELSYQECEQVCRQLKKMLGWKM